jgi:hypothetical protein
LFGLGVSDDLPAWTGELELRKMLWKEYGIQFNDFEVKDVFHAIQYQAAISTRQQHEADKANRGK